VSGILIQRGKGRVFGFESGKKTSRGWRKKRFQKG